MRLPFNRGSGKIYKPEQLSLKDIRITKQMRNRNTEPKSPACPYCYGGTIVRQQEKFSCCLCKKQVSINETSR